MAPLDLTRDWLDTVLRPYPARERLVPEVLDILSSRRTLAVKTDAFTFDSGTTSLLLLLHGTLPITFRGATYHIPVHVWVPHDYPRAPPMAFVVPTRDMGVRKGREVEPGGKVRDEVVAVWWASFEDKTIEMLLKQLTSVFSAAPPVFARPPQPAASAAASSQQASAGPSHSSPQQPPPPPRPEQLPQYQPAQPSVQPPHAHAQGGYSQTHSRQSSYASPPRSPASSQQPPVPARPMVLGPGLQQQGSMPASPSSTNGAGQHAGGPPYVPPRPYVSVPASGYGPDGRQSPATASPHASPQAPAPPGRPLLIQGHPQHMQQAFQYQQQHQEPQQFQTGQGQGYYQSPPHQYPHNAASPQPHQHPQTYAPPPNGTQSSHLPQAAPPASAGPASAPPSSGPGPAPAPRRPVDLMSGADDDDASPTTSSNSTSAPPIPPSKPPPPSLLHLHSILLPHLQASLPPLLQSLHADRAHLLERKEDLASGEPAIRDEMARLEAVRKVCESTGRKMEGVVREGGERVGELEARGEIGVDEVVCGISIVHNQLVDLVAEDNALEDTIYHVTRALEAERIDLDRFLKSIRSLAREQYMKRALIERILQGMGQKQW